MGATMPHFKRIGLLGSLNVPEVKDSLRKLEEFLRSQHCDVIFEQQAASLVDLDVEHSLPAEDFLSAIDLAIVVGGDGSMLVPVAKWPLVMCRYSELTWAFRFFNGYYPGRDC